MTFLELVQSVAALAGISDSGGPATVIDQVGDNRKIINYVQIADKEIQVLHQDWDFLWGSGVIETVAGISTYAGPSDIRIWDANRIRYNDRWLQVRYWSDYEPEIRANAEPEYVVIRPDNQLEIIPTPDDVYQISYDYYRAPARMAGNSSVSRIPSDYDEAIIGRALMLYGTYEPAEESRLMGQEMFNAAMTAMEVTQLQRRQRVFGRSDNVEIVVTPQ